MTAMGQGQDGGGGLLYEIINPSDPVTMIAPSFEAALLATVLVGTGKYAASPVGHDGPEVPMFLFDSFEPWFAERYPGRELSEFLKEHRAETAAALRSFCTGKAHERELFDSALGAITDPKKRAEFIAQWDDKRRSSLNQITNRAHSWADNLEAAEASK